MEPTERRAGASALDTRRRDAAATPSPGPTPSPVADLDAARPAAVRHLCELVRADAYRPPLDEVAERLAAFLAVA